MWYEKNVTILFEGNISQNMKCSMYIHIYFNYLLFHESLLAYVIYLC